jgi:hypothetical protein
MSKAKTSRTPADSWRQHQLRRRAAGKGTRAMPHGRYSSLKRKLSGEVIARPALTLTAEQDALLTEMATLVYYSDGFTYTRPMMKLVKSIADRATPAAQRACLAACPG